MNIVAIPAVFILLLLLSALAALTVGIFIAKPSVRRVLLWVLGLVLVPAFLFLLVIGFRVQRVQSINAVQPIVISQSAGEVPSVWQGDLEEQFRAEVYTRPHAAAFGLGRQIADKHKMMLTGDLQGREVADMSDVESKLRGPLKIILCEDTADMDILEQCRKGLQQLLSKNKIVIQPRSSSGPSEGEVWIVFSLHSEPKSLSIETGPGSSLDLQCNETGIIEAVLQTPEDKMSEQVSYDYRLWLDDIASFKSQCGGQWVVVFSDTASDIQQTQDDAYQKACRIISESVTSSRPQPITLNRDDLERFNLVADSYSQQLWGMTGLICRSALLLDADSQKLAALAQSKVQIIHSQHDAWIYTILSLLGMIVIVWITYSVANTATKGYYSTILALIAVIAVIVLGAILFIA